MDEGSDDVDKMAYENIKDAEKAEDSTEVVEEPMKIDMNDDCSSKMQWVL